MAPAKPLTSVVTGVYDLIEPLEADDRQRVLKSVCALLGDESALPSDNGHSPNTSRDDDHIETGEFTLGVTAKRWMKQNDVTESHLVEVFYPNDEEMEVIATDVLGKSNAEQTRSCYLLAGIRSLLADDAAKFDDSDAVKLCKHFSCYDGKNNAAHRDSLGMGGDKKKGWSLPAPLLKKAAELVKGMSKDDS